MPIITPSPPHALRCSPTPTCAVVSWRLCCVRLDDRWSIDPTIQLSMFVLIDVWSKMRAWTTQLSSERLGRQEQADQEMADYWAYLQRVRGKRLLRDTSKGVLERCEYFHSGGVVSDRHTTPPFIVRPLCLCLFLPVLNLFADADGWHQRQ